jgi:hypothetical protein
MAGSKKGRKQMGSLFFRNYERTMRRIYWLEFVDEQLEAAHSEQYRTTSAKPAGEHSDHSLPVRQRHADQPR